jgi:hypothetical protein
MSIRVLLGLGVRTTSLLEGPDASQLFTRCVGGTARPAIRKCFVYSTLFMREKDPWIERMEEVADRIDRLLLAIYLTTLVGLFTAHF